MNLIKVDGVYLVGVVVVFFCNCKRRTREGGAQQSKLCTRNLFRLAFRASFRLWDRTRHGRGRNLEAMIVGLVS